MTARLKSLRFLPRGEDGWGTPELVFGDVLTLVLGPNGSGKTPVLKGLAFALGHSAEVPNEIESHCLAVKLCLDVEGRRAGLTRTFSDEFCVDVTWDDGTPATKFKDERAFAVWLVEQLGLPYRTLVGLSGADEIPPYMAVLVPAFWIDQDKGWRGIYCPPSSRRFIKDQPEEVLRWLLGVSPRHLPSNRVAYEKAKREAGAIDQLIAIKRKTIAALRLELGPLMAPGSKDAWLREKEALVRQIEDHNRVLELLTTQTTSLDSRIRECVEKRNDASYSLEAAVRRRADLRRLSNELDSEVEILESNEVAAEAFRSLCPNRDCQFFTRPQESYGRRLLYLKDQAKDFAIGQKQLDEQVQELERMLATHRTAVEMAVAEKHKSFGAAPVRKIVADVENTAKLLAGVQHKLELVERFEQANAELDKLVADSGRAQIAVDDLRPRGRKVDGSKVLAVRTGLASAFQKWRKVLRAQNLPTDARVDEQLRLWLGEERFSDDSSHSGSTRTRIVLAYHAALLETSYATHGHHPGFLVLDAPKQNELHTKDLAAFVAKFVNWAREVDPPAQLVVGATEKLLGRRQIPHEEWHPSHSTTTGLRYFGKV